MGRHAARNNCPFCGWYCTDVIPRAAVRSALQGQCYVRCCGCHAQGPMAPNEREATRQWNERAEFRDRHDNPAPRVPIDL